MNERSTHDMFDIIRTSKNMRSKSSKIQKSVDGALELDKIWIGFYPFIFFVRIVNFISIQ